jgi:adenosylcobinamide-GDP ribazoletransferase
MPRDKLEHPGHPRHFLTALAFLTRLGPSRVVPVEDFAPALAWFPLAGFAAGGLAVLPAWLGLFSGYPLLQGWLVTGLGLWITRGLHADGLADISDAWGSSARGERFWAILKDSRAGPFGVLGLVTAVTGQILAYGYLAGQQRLGAVCWCFVLGRMVSLAVIGLCRGRVRPGLASLFAPGAEPATLALALIQTVLLGLALTSLRSMLLAFAASGVILAFLTGLSKRQQGMNGDFMGAAIVLGELAAALAALA